jgi:hypothetical protein
MQREPSFLPAVVYPSGGVLLPRGKYAYGPCGAGNIMNRVVPVVRDLHAPGRGGTEGGA